MFPCETQSLSRLNISCCKLQPATRLLKSFEHFWLRLSASLPNGLGAIVSNRRENPAAGSPAFLPESVFQKFPTQILESQSQQA